MIVTAFIGYVLPWGDFLQVLLKKVGLSLMGRAITSLLMKWGCSGGLALAVAFSFFSAEEAHFPGNTVLPEGSPSPGQKSFPFPASSPVPSVETPGNSNSWISREYGEGGEATSKTPHPLVNERGAETTSPTSSFFKGVSEEIEKRRGVCVPQSETEDTAAGPSQLPLSGPGPEQERDSPLPEPVYLSNERTTCSRKLFDFFTFFNKNSKKGERIVPWDLSCLISRVIIQRASSTQLSQLHHAMDEIIGEELPLTGVEAREAFLKKVSLDLSHLKKEDKKLENEKDF